MTYEELIEKYTRKLKQCVVTGCDTEMIDEMCGRELTLFESWLNRVLKEFYRKKRRPLPKICPSRRTIDQLQNMMNHVAFQWAEEFGRDWLGHAKHFGDLPEHVQFRTIELMFVALKVVFERRLADVLE